MSEIDDRREALRERLALVKDLLLRENLTEEDVRAKLIDPLFVHALGWPEAVIRREQHTTGGERIDYIFGHPAVHFLLEAKRADTPFTFPAPTIRKTHVIQALASADKSLGSALEQVARYCQDEGHAFAVLSNGLQLCAFRAVRSDRPWRKGECLVFESPDELLARFSELWEVLSYPAATRGSLTAYFSLPDDAPKHHKSVMSGVPNPDETLIRNSLSTELIPLLKGVFQDLTDPSQLEELQRCYVYSKTLESTANDFVITLSDLPPSYLKGQVTDVRPTFASAGAFQAKVRELEASEKHGLVMLLLGGVGAGKSTFLHQVRVKYCADVIERAGAYFYLDFRDAPLQPEFEAFVYRALRAQLTTAPYFRGVAEQLVKDLHPYAVPLTSPQVLKALFKTELQQVDELAAELGITDANEIGKQRLERFQALATDDREVIRRALRATQAAGRFVLIAFDNADQLTLEYQLQIFLFAQNIAAETGASVIVALREEKFYLASQYGAFSAFHVHKFHIPSPRLTDLLSLRLRYACEKLDRYVGGSSRLEDIRAFMLAIWIGGVGGFGRRGSSNVVRLLERVCLGNMRLALEMFRTFVQSGNTHVEKILRIYNENVGSKRIPYHVPFHEFTKSVMLGDYRYYLERHSPVMNVFAPSGCAPNSHFTALRVLQSLMESSERASPFGRGFVDVQELTSKFTATFGTSEDLLLQMGRLLQSALIEADTGVGNDLERCRAVRATAAGEYYLVFLARAFAYLDLVFMDTPLSDLAVLSRLTELRAALDKDRRFERVDLFLQYLRDQERREFKSYPALLRLTASPLMPQIIEQIDKEKKVISSKYARYST